MYNRWGEADKLAHLKASLVGDAGQVLWDSDASATGTLEKLTSLLRSRYSGSRQADKYRSELRLHRRRAGESLCTLHQDIRRLMALAHPTLQQEAREATGDKVAAVRDWPTPHNLSQLCSFLGLCSYYRRFIQGFADVAAPLHALQRKQVPFHWTWEQEEAFNQLKQQLTSAPVLGMPTDVSTFYLDCDASDVGLGSVLSQEEGGSEVVIAYASRALTFI